MIRISKKSPKPKAGSKADLLAEWLASTLIVPAGPHRGEPLQLLDFQLRFLRDHFADDFDGGPEYRTCVLSTARKNGKTSTLACLVLGYMCEDSPLFVPGFRGAVTAPTVQHAQLIPQQIVDLIDAAGYDPDLSFIKSPLPGVMHGPHGGKLQCLSGQRTAGHGLDLDLALVDETGLMPNSNETLQNVFDSTAARNGRVILTGTQADSPAYREILDRPDKSTKIHLYAADLTDDISDPAVWAKANPGLGTIKSKAFMNDAHGKAESTGSLTAFRVWHGNMPLSPTRQLLLEYDQLEKAYSETAELEEGEGVYLGLDLGGSAAMTAAVIIGQDSGAIKSLAAFPSDGLDLVQRGQRDAVGLLYVKLADAGQLHQTAGAVTDIAEFLTLLREEIGNHPVLSISCDRYRSAEATTAMQRAKIDWPIKFRGTGPRDGDNDIRATRRLFLSGKAKLRRSLLLEAAIAEADVRVSATGAVQLDKSHANARIDVAQALVLACAAFVTALDAPQPEFAVEMWG